MITVFSNLARAGVIALGVLTAVTSGAGSAPVGPILIPQSAQAPGGTAAGANLPVELVQQREWRRNRGWGNGNRGWRGDRGWRGGNRVWRGGREWRGGRHWRGDDGWRNGNRAWRGNREWRRDRGWRHDRRWARRNYWRDPYWYGGSGLYLGFGAPYWGYNWGYADPGYYAPRYRAPVRASSHAEWCYARYRSYRAYDNTFQPYYGPRRECISPFI